MSVLFRKNKAVKFRNHPTHNTNTGTFTLLIFRGIVVTDLRMVSNVIEFVRSVGTLIRAAGGMLLNHIAIVGRSLWAGKIVGAPNTRVGASGDGEKRKGREPVHYGHDINLIFFCILFFTSIFETPTARTRGVHAIRQIARPDINTTPSLHSESKTNSSVVILQF